MDDTRTRAALQGLINDLEQGATNQGPDELVRDDGGVRGKFFFLPGGILCQCSCAAAWEGRQSAAYQSLLSGRTWVM